MNTLESNDEHYIELGDGTFWYPGRDDNTFSVDALARAVAKLCRFTGHTSEFYSVAEHLVKISYAVPEDLALEALVHDLHEGLVNDLSRPVKYYIGGTYKALEDKAETELRRYLGVPEKLNPIVKDADIKMCLIEANDLMPSRGKHWDYYDDHREGAKELVATDPYLEPHCWHWERAYREFMHRYDGLTDRGDKAVFQRVALP